MSKRRSGLSNHRRAYVYGCNNDTTQSCATTIEGLTWVDFSPTGNYSAYAQGWALSWDPIPNGTVYNITQPDVAEQTFELLTSTSGNLYTNYDFANDGYGNDFIVYAHVSGCPDISGSVAPCFLKGALVSLADGSSKPIEDIRVGDIVLGAFGEHNEVLALHRPLLGNNTMTNINNDHHTSSHHPHISCDKKFYAIKPSVVMSDTYGKSHEVLDENMVPYQRFLAGLKHGRVEQMDLGILLKTVDGSREITFLDTYEMAPETQLYNLVISGSHTYYVDGYAVTGWPNEEDFDYDSWEARKS
jgi:Hom_end-associated Hint